MRKLKRSTLNKKHEESFKKYGKEYSEDKFFDKIKKYAQQAGMKVVYTAMLLYYAYKRKETPMWARNVILGTLGYFISPIDALPDLTPLIGYTDDVGVLSFGLVTIACYVNDEVRIKARKKVKKWFGKSFDLAELKEVDDKI